VLYHFSEEPDIGIFVPRVKANRTDMPPVVWAIDEAHAFTFYFPRNCPRIVYTKSPDINDRDMERFFGLSKSDIVVTIESHWYRQLKHFTIYRYAFEEDGFELFDRYAGYYIAERTVHPVEVTPMNDLIEKLLDLGIELRLTPDLSPLREQILASSMTDFGIHRYEFAKSERDR